MGRQKAHLNVPLLLINSGGPTQDINKNIQQTGEDNAAASKAQSSGLDKATLAQADFNNAQQIEKGMAGLGNDQASCTLKQSTLDSSKLQAGISIKAGKDSGKLGKDSNFTSDKDARESGCGVESPSVSKTLGEEDTDSGSSVGEPQVMKESAANGVMEKKGPWVDLFKSNRKLDNGPKLQAVEQQSGEVILCETDADNVEDACGYGLVGYFAGRFPGKSALLQLCNSWKVEYQYFVHSSGWLVFKFGNDSDRLSVLHGGPYFVFGRPLMLKAMPRYFEFDDKEISYMPVWINLPSLPLELWNSRALSKIVSKVGNPISTDKLTATIGRISYARVLVEVDASTELVRTVKIKLPNGVLREQEIRYEHEPKFCASCKVIGHPTTGCKHKMAKIPTVDVQMMEGQKSNQPGDNVGLHVAGDQVEHIDSHKEQNGDQNDAAFIEVINSRLITPTQVPENDIVLLAKSGADCIPILQGTTSKAINDGNHKGKLDDRRKAGIAVDKKKGTTLASSS